LIRLISLRESYYRPAAKPVAQSSDPFGTVGYGNGQEPSQHEISEGRRRQPPGQGAPLQRSGPAGIVGRNGVGQYDQSDRVWGSHQGRSGGSLQQPGRGNPELPTDEENPPPPGHKP